VEIYLFILPREESREAVVTEAEDNVESIDIARFSQLRKSSRFELSSGKISSDCTKV